MEEHLRRLQMAASRGQGPRLRPSHTLSHRNMPQWVSRTLVHPSAVPPPPPPGPPGGQVRERDNDYEEIGPPARRQAAEQAMNTSGRQKQQQQQARAGGGDGKDRVHCDLCGSSASAVRCDKCSGQVFCLSCDDMYHRHPKRSAHVRKAVDSIQRPFRPPLPPKSDLQPPVPPPRRNKRFGLFGKREQQSPALPRKESASGVMGSLKRFMGVRPLPPPPTQKGGLTSVWEEPSVQPLPPNLGRPQASVQRSLSRGSADSGRPPSDDTNAALPATVATINAEERHQRQTGQDERDMDRNPGPIRPRSQSVAAPMSLAQQQQQQQQQLQQQQQAWMYPHEHQHQHQSHDMLQGFVTTRRGQSYRAGWPGAMAGGGSVCDMASTPAGHHMGHHPGHFHPQMMHAQSMAQLGCPTCHGHGQAVWYPSEPPEDHLHRYPSNTSLTAGYPAPGGRFVSQRDIRQPSPAPSARSGRASRSRRLARSQMELSRYPTDSDDHGSGVESDDESDRPADEGATTAWACPHCTFQNSAGTRVCSMCCRTAPAAATHQRAAQKKRRRRRFPRGPMPPGSPAPLRARDPSPGSISHSGRERTDRSMSRGPSLGRELGRDVSTSELTDGMQSMKLDVQERPRDRRPSDAAVVTARRGSVASVSATESSAPMSSTGTGTSDAERGETPAAAPPPPPPLPADAVQTRPTETGRADGEKRTQSTGTSPPPQTIATQTNEDPAMYSSESLPRAGSRSSLTGDYEPFRYGSRPAQSLKRTQSFQAFGHRERQERADPWLSYGTLGSRFQGRSGSKSSVHSTASDSRAFGAYTSGASSRGESPARFSVDRTYSRHHSYGGEMARKPADGSDYLVGLEEVMMNRKSDSSANQGMELVLMLRDAEKHNFSPEDLQIALNHCSERAPVPWLLDNLDSMIETVCTLATNYGHERPENDVGTISNKEARDALRLHKGNVWSAVTECVEQRRKKYAQLAGRGSFSREDIITALTANHGSVEAAYLDLNRTQLKPFLMRIWGPPQGVEVNEGAPQGHPEVAPAPAGEGEVKVAAVPADAEVNTIAPKGSTTAATAAAAEIKIAAAEDSKVTVAPAGSAEVKVTPKVTAPTVLAAAKTDNSGSRSDQCSALSSEIDSDDDDACKSKDYITPPTSPLLLRANPTAKPASDPAPSIPATSPSTSVVSPTSSQPSSSHAAGLAPVASPYSSISPSAASSTSDISSSSGAYETIAKPAPARKHAAVRPEEDRLPGKPAGSQPLTKKEPTASTEDVAETKKQPSQTEQQRRENVQQHDQPVAPSAELTQTQPQEQPTSSVPVRAGQEKQTEPRPRPRSRPSAPAAPSAALGDRTSSDDYEPAVYGDMLITRSAQSTAAPQPDTVSDPVRPEESSASGSSKRGDSKGTSGSPAVSSSQAKDSSISKSLSGTSEHRSDTSTVSKSDAPIKTVDVAAPTTSSTVLKTDVRETSTTSSSRYSTVKKPRPVSSPDLQPSVSSAAKREDEAASAAAKNVKTKSTEDIRVPAVVTQASAKPATSTTQNQVASVTQPAESPASASLSAGATPLPESDAAESPERRSSDSSTSSSTDITEKEQLTRPQSSGWVSSNIYASPAKGAPRAAPGQTAGASASSDTPSPSTPIALTTQTDASQGAEGTDSEDVETTAPVSAAEAVTASVSSVATSSDKMSPPPPDTAYETISTARAETSSSTSEADPVVSGDRPSPSPSVSPTPGPIIASSRHNLSPSERLELAKRVICNHVQRQRPGPASAAIGAASTGAESPAGAASSPTQPPVHHGPDGPYTPSTASEMQSIDDDGADYADVGPGAIGRPRTLRHVTADVTPASDSSGEDNAIAAAAPTGSHVVFTSSDSLSEGYEAVVSVRFQPGDGRGGGVRSSTRSPMPALVASSSAESLSRSDHQVALQVERQVASPSAAADQAAVEAAAEGPTVVAAGGSAERSVGVGAEPAAVVDADDSQGATGQATGPARTAASPTGSAPSRAEPAVTGSAPEGSSSDEAVGGLGGTGSSVDQLQSSSSGQKESDDSPSGQATGHTSEVSRDSESTDSDADSEAAAARPDDLDVEALKEGLKNGRSPVLRKNSAERQKVQRRASRLLRSGRAQSQAEAEMASQLMALRFPADDSLQAANQCSSLYAAVSFLHQECELCAGRYSAKEMVCMTYCTHRCCHSCAQAYFTQRIKERPLADLRCPFCNEPDLTNEEIASDYFSHLDIMLKTLVSPEIHGLFHKKLFDRAMMKDPNFKWCPKCSSGFIAAPRQQKLNCPDCGTVSCALCSKTWSPQHEGATCEKFAMWQQQNDPDYQSVGLERHLAESGISCPSCKFRYSLAKGGCMHFTCSQCKYEFCSGCSRPFSMGSKCGKTELCSRLGLHAHHPRNCLFYLRDKEPKQLQQLLKNNGVEYNTEPPGGNEAYGDVPRRCRVPEQKDTVGGLKDDLCGRIVFPDNAGLCRMHYIEYLCGLVWKHKLDPVSISDASDLRQEMRRHGRRVRIQRVKESDDKYTAALRRIVETELPLDV